MLTNGSLGKARLALFLLPLVAAACSSSSGQVQDGGVDVAVGDGALGGDSAGAHTDGALSDGALSDGVASGGDAAPSPDAKPLWYPLGASELHPWSTSPGSSAAGGGLSASSRWSSLPAIVLDDDDRPIVAWNESGALYVQRFDGQRWIALGGSSTTAGIAKLTRAPRLALDDVGRPVVAWIADGSLQPHAARFDDGSWVGLDGGPIAPLSSDSAASLDLSRSRSATPALAWSTKSHGTSRVYVAQFRDGGWHQLDDSASGSGLGDPDTAAENPGVALDGAGLPLVTWLNGFGRIYLKRWTGSSWQQIGASASGDGLSRRARSNGRPAVAVDGRGGVAVGWIEGVPLSFSTLDHVYLRRWDGESWQQLGGSASGDGLSVNHYDDSHGVSLTVAPGGDLWVSWVEPTNDVDAIRLRRWSSDSWHATAGPTMAHSPALAIAKTGSPVLSWVAGRDVFAARRDGDAWTGYGTALSDGGLKGTAGAVDVLHLIAHGDELVAGWRERSGGRNVARGQVTRWQGGSWTDLGQCCSSDIRSPPGDFDLQVAPDGSPVALWRHRADHGYSNSRTVIYLRRYDATWQPIGSNIEFSSSGGTGLALMADSSALLAYSTWQSGGLQTFRATSWQDDAWETFDTLTRETAVEELALARDGQNRVVLSWRGYSRSAISVFRSGGDGWDDLGEVGQNVWSYALVIGPDDTPMVAWHDDDNRIHFAQRGADGWVGLAGSDLAAGIGPAESPAYVPSLALDPQGRPVVAYRDEGTGQQQIYLLRWNGAAWVEHNGSASAGGVSNSRGASDLPAVAVTSGAICVSWTEPGNTDGLVLLRCSDL